MGLFNIFKKKAIALQDMQEKDHSITTQPKTFTCARCKKEIADEESKWIGNHRFCSECATPIKTSIIAPLATHKEEKTYICARCKKEITDEESKWIGNHRFCRKCGTMSYSKNTSDQSIYTGTEQPSPNSLPAVKTATGKLSEQQIIDLYKMGELTKPEFLLLLSTEKDVYFRKYVYGVGEFRLYYDSNVSREYYYTNVPEVLRAFYSMHVKYPDYHLDKRLEELLILMTSSKGGVYQILTLLYYHIQNEKNGTSTFSMNSIEILSRCKEVIKDNTQYFLEIRRYEGKNNEEGYLGVFKNYNCIFKEILNFDLFDYDIRTFTDSAIGDDTSTKSKQNVVHSMQMKYVAKRTAQERLNDEKIRLSIKEQLDELAANTDETNDVIGEINISRLFLNCSDNEFNSAFLSDLLGGATLVKYICGGFDACEFCWRFAKYNMLIELSGTSIRGGPILIGGTYKVYRFDESKISDDFK